MRSNKARNVVTIVLALIIVASLITAFLSASADGLLSDNENTNSYPEGNLEEELYELALKDEFGQLNIENIEKILRSSERFTEEGFNWLLSNVNVGENGQEINSYIAMIDVERTNKIVAVINDFLSISHGADKNEEVIEQTNDGDPMPTVDNPEFTEVVKEVEETLAQREETQLVESEKPQTFQGAFFRNRGTYTMESETGYAVRSAQNLAGIEEAYKTVTKQEKFRHMEVELSILPKLLGGGEEGVDADIVLILDESPSMTGEKWKSVKEVAAEVSRQIFKMSPNSKVGVVSYNSKPYVVSMLKGADEVEALVAAILKKNDIRGYTNGQAGIITARENVLGINDDWTEDDVLATGRKKILINLTDGMPNENFTDAHHEWPTPDMTPTAHKRLKRWGSYVFAPGWGAANKIKVEGSRWLNNDIDQRTKDLWVQASTHLAGPLGGFAGELHGELVYVLESQYTVSKGIDLFVIDYSTDDYDIGGTIDPIETQRRAREVQALSTYKMIDPPETFRYYPPLWSGDDDVDAANAAEILRIAELNPIENSSFTSVNYEGRVYSAENADELLEAFDDILTIIKGKVPTYTVDDYYNNEIYELVEEPVASGGEAAGAVISVNGNHIEWISGGQSTNKRTVKYMLRVKDEPVYPDGAGTYNQNAPTVQGKLPTGAAAKISFVDGDGATHAYDYEVPLVSIERLIDGLAFGYDRDGNVLGSVFTDKLYLGGTITRGNGDYSFEWFHGPDDTGTPITTSPLDVASTIEGFTLSIPLDKVGPIMDSAEGTKQFTLKLYDDIATRDGYKSRGVSYILRTIEVCVVTGEVRVIVKDVEDGQKTKGLFETRVSKGLDTDAKEEFDNWYFLGPDIKVYKVGLFVDPATSVVSTSGFIKLTAQTYIPYGYKLEVTKADSVLSDNTGVIEIKPVKNGSNWSLPSKEIIIEVTKVERNFFYDWAWGNNKEDTVIFNKETTVK